MAQPIADTCRSFQRPCSDGPACNHFRRADRLSDRTTHRGVHRLMRNQSVRSIPVSPSPPKRREIVTCCDLGRWANSVQLAERNHAETWLDIKSAANSHALGPAQWVGTPPSAATPAAPRPHSGALPPELVPQREAHSAIYATCSPIGAYAQLQVCHTHLDRSVIVRRAASTHHWQRWRCLASTNAGTRGSGAALQVFRQEPPQQSPEAAALSD